MPNNRLTNRQTKQLTENQPNDTSTVGIQKETGKVNKLRLILTDRWTTHVCFIEHLQCCHVYDQIRGHHHVGVQGYKAVYEYAELEKICPPDAK